MSAAPMSTFERVATINHLVDQAKAEFTPEDPGALWDALVDAGFALTAALTIASATTGQEVPRHGSR